MTTRAHDLARIEKALVVAGGILKGFEPGGVAFNHKANRDLVTAADLEIDHALKEELLDEREGWLSEETADSNDRLAARRVWVVDPLDGTREFVEGIPEWCVSVGLVEDGVPVAGGILNPDTDFMALGALGHGCRLNGTPVRTSRTSGLAGALVLASRTEVGRGEWNRWNQPAFQIQPMGSVAYKLARVACGLADATWTLVPKHEWDVAAGVALVTAAGGWVATPEGDQPRFNQPSPRLSGLLAAGRNSLKIPILRALRSIALSTYSQG